ncbi:MAG: hypothetical protein Q8R67_02415 [Rhodoferax sp.]|nr:hypothetical protein [Rhodoferax sp.]MDP3650514.1 hypothetical protein [Rhodoferax sp.]
MINFSVRSDLEATVSQWARIAGDQMPYATAVALTRTAKAAKDEIDRQLPSLIDRPTPYTMKGFRLYRATKRKLYAEVTFQEAFGRGTAARDYLSPLVYGGERKLKAFERSLQRTGLLPSGYAAVPGSAAKLDAWGNMSRGQIVQILSYFKAFGEQGYSANITDKRKLAMKEGRDKRTGQRGVVYFVGRPGNGRLPLGIWQRTSLGAMGTAIKPVIIFVSKVSYRQRLDVPGIAKRVIDERFVEELRRAVGEAMRTAIPKQQMQRL